MTPRGTINSAGCLSFTTLCTLGANLATGMAKISEPPAQIGLHGGLYFMSHQEHKLMDLPFHIDANSLYREMDMQAESILINAHVAGDEDACERICAIRDEFEELDALYRSV